jgi:peptidyl-tRNA hydrolase, PTH1 family
LSKFMSSLEEKNWLIVGLGNPGEQYEKTRHNLGFMVADELARKFNTLVRRVECRALTGQFSFENQTVEIVKPQTYMNLSGESIACFLKKENRSVKKLVVVTDDLALPVGKIRLRGKGSAGGHNGLKSLIECLRTEDFIRLRIGIKPEHQISETKRFVLEKFSKSDLETVEKVLEQSVEAVLAVISDGVERAMAKYN